MHEVSFQDKEKEHLTRLQDAEEMKVSECVFELCAYILRPVHVSVRGRGEASCLGLQSSPPGASCSQEVVRGLPRSQSICGYRCVAPMPVPGIMGSTAVTTWVT